MDENFEEMDKKVTAYVSTGHRFSPGVREAYNVQSDVMKKDFGTYLQPLLLIMKEDIGIINKQIELIRRAGHPHPERLVIQRLFPKLEKEFFNNIEEKEKLLGIDEEEVEVLNTTLKAAVTEGGGGTKRLKRRKFSKRKSSKRKSIKRKSSKRKSKRLSRRRR